MNSIEKQPQKKVKKHNHFLFDFMKVTGILPALLIFRPKYHFLGKTQSNKVKGRVLIVANHSGFFDPLVLLLAFWRRRMRFWATREFFEKKPTSFFFKYCFDTIPVDKENFRMETVRDTVAYLQNGEIVAIFPEGRVNVENHDELQPFKRGAAMMALKGDAPILPTYIHPRPHKYGRQIILFDDPITLNEILGREATFRDLKDVSAFLQKKEQELMARYHELYDENGKPRKNKKKEQPQA